jgi:hypothetical protein
VIAKMKKGEAYTGLCCSQVLIYVLLLTRIYLLNFTAFIDNLYLYFYVMFKKSFEYEFCRAFIQGAWKVAVHLGYGT